MHHRRLQTVDVFHLVNGIDFIQVVEVVDVRDAVAGRSPPQSIQARRVGVVDEDEDEVDDERRHDEDDEHGGADLVIELHHLARLDHPETPLKNKKNRII